MTIIVMTRSTSLSLRILQDNKNSFEAAQKKDIFVLIMVYLSYVNIMCCLIIIVFIFYDLCVCIV